MVKSLSIKIIAPCAVLLVAVVVLVNIFAANSKSTVNADVALQGFDPVAYFVDRASVRGRKDLAVNWNGYIFHFNSENNVRLFLSDPEFFQVQYEGYCALGRSMGMNIAGNPNVWEEYNDKIYLFSNERTRKMWLKDIEGNISISESKQHASH